MRLMEDISKKLDKLVSAQKDLKDEVSCIGSRLKQLEDSAPDGQVPQHDQTWESWCAPFTEWVVCCWLRNLCCTLFLLNWSPFHKDRWEKCPKRIYNQMLARPSCQHGETRLFWLLSTAVAMQWPFEDTTPFAFYKGWGRATTKVAFRYTWSANVFFFFSGFKNWSPTKSQCTCAWWLMKKLVGKQPMSLQGLDLNNLSKIQQQTVCDLLQAFLDGQVRSANGYMARVCPPLIMFTAMEK